VGAPSAAAAARSEHGVGGAVVRGMTAKAMRQAGVAPAGGKESATRTAAGQSIGGEVAVSAVVVQHQATPTDRPPMRRSATSPLPLSAARSSLRSMLGGVGTSAAVERSLLSGVYPGVTCGAVEAGAYTRPFLSST
jgi:hypothetical protein